MVVFGLSAMHFQCSKQYNSLASALGLVQKERNTARHFYLHSNWLMRQQVLHIHYHYYVNSDIILEVTSNKHVKTSSLTIDESVSGPLSPLYFLTVISAADGQRISSPPSPICRDVLLNTTCGRRSRAVSRFGIFCGQGFAQMCRPTSATAIPHRWPSEENSGLSHSSWSWAVIRIPPWKESGGVGRLSFSRHDMPRPSWSSTSVNHAASNINAYPTVARLSEF